MQVEKGDTIVTRIEVQKFETSAVISKQEGTTNHFDESHCIQYVADKEDHNINTIDGNNTFHGMGIISCITPGLDKAPIHIEFPRLDKGRGSAAPSINTKGNATSQSYISQMQNLESDHPDIHAHFMNGNHVVRRTDRFLAGLSKDLVIEQVLMRSVKTTGGLTRGRDMGEAQRAPWLLSIPTLAAVIWNGI
ncbi:unnamed protein product [Mytilus coruscus]|uniref:Uncharacterized protein n=1 Tax=Mytilus coruscus TaxID=42192 RepID=A0A6J8BPA6_MYTCO|nr:unnamed protein product [Mytilus coruscus]